MKNQLSNVAALLIAVVLGVMITLWATQTQTVHGQGKMEGGPGGPRYSVIDTEGHNLLVTDNKTNTLYFYTIDKDAEIGSELKLRGHVDLNQVGKDGIMPVTTKKKQGDPK